MALLWALGTKTTTHMHRPPRIAFGRYKVEYFTYRSFTCTTSAGAKPLNHVADALL